jgi:hypothetical protein
MADLLSKFHNNWPLGSKMEGKLKLGKCKMYELSQNMNVVYAYI